MSTKNNGGPAFPSSNSQNSPYPTGMTLRDYIAIKAMNGMIAAPNLNKDGSHVVGWLAEDLPFTGGWKGRIAIAAYAMADEMLKARETK